MAANSPPGSRGHGPPGNNERSVLPIYLVIDVSGSLAGVAHEVNSSIHDFAEAIVGNPIVSNRVRVCVISFSNRADVVMPLSALINSAQLPDLKFGGSTNYSSALELARTQISADVNALKKSGDRVFRPVLLFFTDGEPVDVDWRTSLARLQAESFQFRPTIFAFGISAVSPTTLRELAGDRGRGFVIASHVDDRDAIRSVFDGLSPLVSSITSSTESGVAGPALSLPREWLDTHEGWTETDAI